MGRIADRIKKDVADKFARQCDKGDKKQEMDADGMGFKIKRNTNIILVYDGNLAQYKTIYPPKGEEVYFEGKDGEKYHMGYDGDDDGHNNRPSGVMVGEVAYTLEEMLELYKADILYDQIACIVAGESTSYCDFELNVKGVNNGMLILEAEFTALP